MESENCIYYALIKRDETCLFIRESALIWLIARFDSGGRINRENIFIEGNINLLRVRLADRTGVLINLLQTQLEYC